MKYSVLVALLGTSSAIKLEGEPERSNQTTQYDEFGPSEKTQNLMPRAYERSANSNKVDGVRVSRTTFYSQLDDQLEYQTPDQSRAAWQSTRDASRQEVATQEKFQKEHNAMVAKNYADDVAKTNEKKWKDSASRINMMNGGTTPFKTVTNAKLDTKYAQLSTPDESRAAWQSTRDASRQEVATQEKFQKEHNAMVAKNYADDVAKTNEKKWKDSASKINMMNGGTTPFKTVTNAKLDTMYAQQSTPDQSRAAWQSTRDASRQEVATQEKFMKEHNAMVAKNYADDVAKTNEKKWKDSASKINMMNGGTTPFKTVTNAKLNTAYAQVGYVDGSHPVSIYETNGADSNRDHKSPQVLGPKLSTQQQGWQSKGNSHYWAVEDLARQQGFSNEVNPWNKPLTLNNDVNLDKSKSLYTSLNQIGAFDNEADKSFGPAKKVATGVTSTQQSFENKKTADVAARNAANIAETQAFKDKIGAVKNKKYTEFSNYVQYVPEEDVMMDMSKFVTDDEYRREQAYKAYKKSTYEQDD